MSTPHVPSQRPRRRRGGPRRARGSPGHPGRPPPGLLVGALAVAGVAAVVASAAQLGLTGSALSAGGSGVGSCAEHVAVDYGLEGLEVVEVTLSEIAGACGGGRLHVEVVGPDGHSVSRSVGDGTPIPIGADTVTRDLEPAVHRDAIAGVEVLVVGP